MLLKRIGKGTLNGEHLCFRPTPGTISCPVCLDSYCEVTFITFVASILFYICCLPGWTAESCFLIGVLMFADCRQRQISRIHQMWSCVLQPVSERCSDVFAHVSHLQEAIDPPPVPPTLHLTSSHCEVCPAVLSLFSLFTI